MMLLARWFGQLVMLLVVLLPTAIPAAEFRDLKVEGKAPADFVAAQSGKAWAVVIGIDAYQKIGSLRYAVADAKAVARTLRQRGYEVTELYNERATKRAIESELRTKLPRKVGEHDRVLIFYAGHGQDEKVKGGKPMGYLVPVDGERDDIPATGVSMGTVKELADALPAKHALFILDVCFGGIAGTLTRGQPPAVTEAYLKQITRERGRHLITAGGADQQVIESAQWGHSVFTYFLLKGLNEGLADQDDNGVITAQELYTYLESRVFGEAQQQGHTQTPQMAELSGEKGQFVFFTSARPLPGSSPTLGEGKPVLSPAEGVGAGPSAALSQAEQELKALQEQERQVEEQARQAQLQRQIEEKKRQIEEKKKKLEVAKAPTFEAPREMGREITGKDGAPMVLVPEGEFLYGRNNQRLSLPAFYMDKYELTTKLYAGFLQATGRVQPTDWLQQVVLVGSGDRPVVNVTWHDADAYCRYYGKRLPTEQEWEKAARGTDGRKYPWGNEEPTSRHALFNKKWNGYGTLAVLGSHEAGASPYGAQDMAGNVWERTSSHNISGQYSPVIRGGSWGNPASGLPAWTRGGGGRGHPDSISNFVGFRCVRDAPK